MEAVRIRTPGKENTVTRRFRVPLHHRVAAIRNRILDMLYSPVISRLTDEQYYDGAIRTRRDCLRAVLRARLGR